MSKEQRKQRGKLKAQVVFPQPEGLLSMSDDYEAFVRQLKEQIVRQRLNAVVQANSRNDGAVLADWTRYRHQAGA
jgi:hypothetical protein